MGVCCLGVQTVGRHIQRVSMGVTTAVVPVMSVRVHSCDSVSQDISGIKRANCLKSFGVIGNIM